MSTKFELYSPIIVKQTQAAMSCVAHRGYGEICFPHKCLPRSKCMSMKPGSGQGHAISCPLDVTTIFRSEEVTYMESVTGKKITKISYIQCHK